MYVSFSDVLSYVGRGLAMGRSPVQGVYLKGFIVSQVKSVLRMDRGD